MTTTPAVPDTFQYIIGIFKQNREASLEFLMNIDPDSVEDRMRETSIMHDIASASRIIGFLNDAAETSLDAKCLKPADINRAADLIHMHLVHESAKIMNTTHEKTSENIAGICDAVKNVTLLSTFWKFFVDAALEIQMSELKK